MYITETNNTLTVILEGREQVAAMKAKIAIPKESIQKVAYAPKFNDWRSWQMRMPGTFAPKLLMAGSYWTEEGWDFIYAKKPKGIVRPEIHNVLVVETDQNKFRRVIVACSQKRAEEIIASWKASRKHS